MDWDNLTAFRAVADELSFTRAAAQMHIAQPSLSRRVAKLENSLGVRLLDRSSHHVALTDAGRLLRTRLDDIATIWGNTGRDLHVLATSAPPTRLRIAVSGQKLDVLLEQLNAHLPETAWETKQLLPKAALAELTSGVVDFAYTYETVSDPLLPIDDVKAITIAYQPSWLTIARDHRLAQAQHIVLADLAEENWITNTPGHPLRESDSSAFRASGFEPRIVHTGDIVATALDLIATNKCVSLASPIAAMHDHRVVTIPVANGPRRNLFLAWSPDRVPVPTVQRVLSAVRDCYRSQAQGFPRYWSWLLTHQEGNPGLFKEQ